MSLATIRAEIQAWADMMAPNRTAHGALCKLVLEEIPEFLSNLDSPGEYADCLILLIDIATLRGIDIEQAVADKMNVNKHRIWRHNPETGFMKHVKIDQGERVQAGDLRWCGMGNHYAMVDAFCRCGHDYCGACHEPPIRSYV
jgi:hypothetical protein